MRLYHGIDLSVPRAAEAETTRDPHLILSVAQLWERKGLRYLVEACGLLRDRGTEFRCQIIGEGPQRDELQALVDELGVGDRVQLTGALPFPEVVARYGQASVFVLPCIVTEEGDRDGIPNVILEAMLSGVPVVSTPVSGIPEVVRHRETGISVPERDAAAIADAVQELFGERAFAEQLAAAAGKLVREEFDLERNVDRLIEQFEAVGSGAR
jgi:glycosyltransferase involved in cell wall biosynthesis